LLVELYRFKVHRSGLPSIHKSNFDQLDSHNAVIMK
jgi:hypothetical protein